MIPIGFLGQENGVVKSFKDYVGNAREYQLGFVGRNTYAWEKLTVKPAIQVMLMNIPDKQHTLDCILFMKAMIPNVRIVVLLNQPEFDFVLRSMRLGVDGILEKNSILSNIVSAIRDGVNGHAYISPAISRILMNGISQPKIKQPYPLTNREKDVLHLIMEGFSNKVIAENLCIGLETTRTHIKHICEKFEVNSKAEVICKILREKITLDAPS